MDIIRIDADGATVEFHQQELRLLADVLLNHGGGSYDRATAVNAMRGCFMALAVGSHAADGSRHGPVVWETYKAERDAEERRIARLHLDEAEKGGA
jgi:hypothetical protein